MLYLTNLDVNSLTIINNKVYTLSQIIVLPEVILKNNKIFFCKMKNNIDMVTEVFGQLDNKTIWKASLVCKEWQTILKKAHLN